MAEYSYWKILTRRKALTAHTHHESKLSRVMTTFDLTTLGIGATLGVGVYVLAGHVARDQAGPAVVLSFAIAALTSLLAGMCYAEFGARVPRAGSAYIYSYVCIGEFVAFIIGWNLILEYIIGSASVSKGISLYLDTLINDTLKNTFMEITPIKWGFLGTYFDIFAFATAFSFGICLAFGIHSSTIINNCLTVLNIIIVAVVVVAGSFKADIKNWQIDPKTVNTTENVNLGAGGFFPFGFEGTLRGAATCFFGFVGFDCIATTGEEVKNPERAIPRSILFTLLTIFVAYFSVATVLTLMWPYYLQDVNAPLPFVFQEIGWPALKWIVTIGGMVGLFASLFGAMFPLPRIIYAMSQDGLVFKSLGKISTRFKTPVLGTICAAFLTGLMSGLFELTQLVNMLSIGTLLAYTVVAISITLLRFMDNSIDAITNNQTYANRNQIKMTTRTILKQIINMKRLDVPNDLSTRIVGTILFFYCVCCFAFSLMVMYVPNEILNLQPWALGILITLLLLLILLLLTISIQPREEVHSCFKVPFVPFTPGISIFVNIYLMLQLDIYTWIRFGIWMVLGIIIYFTCICIYKRNRIRNDNLFRTMVKSNGTLSFIGTAQKHNNDKTILNGNGTLSNATILILENELTSDEDNNNITIHSVLSKSSTNKSLDEIIPESELSDNHKEMKNPNGKTFFIESSSSLSDFNTNGNSNSDSGISGKKDEDDDAAKTAIAILDDILKTEESILTIHEINNRKESVDSAMIPSFIEASTIATVHKSYESLREEENENWIGDNKLQQQEYGPDFIIPKNITNEDILNLVQINNESAKGSNVHIDQEISEKQKNSKVSQNVNNSAIKEACTESSELETIGEKRSVIEENQNQSKSNPVQEQTLGKKITLVESSDKNAEISDDNENAIHSLSFKERLSQLISRPRLVTAKSKKDETKDEELNSTLEDNSKLKTSKSDSDLQHAILLEISTINHIKNLSNETTQTASTIAGSSIPQAPKFDPVLFKSLKNIKHYKARTKLHDFESQEVTNTNITEEQIPTEQKIESITSPIPFKKKLEALLKRGPSFIVRNQISSTAAGLSKSLTSSRGPEEFSTLSRASKETLPSSHASEEFSTSSRPSEETSLSAGTSVESLTVTKDYPKINHNARKSVNFVDTNSILPHVTEIIERPRRPKMFQTNNNRPTTIEEALQRLRPLNHHISSVN